MKDKVIQQILKEIAHEYGLTIREVEEIYSSQWEFIHDKVTALELNDVDEDEFNELKTNFNIPSFGKFFTTYRRLDNVRRKGKEVNGEGSFPENDVQQHSGDSREESEL